MEVRKQNIFKNKVLKNLEKAVFIYTNWFLY